MEPTYDFRKIEWNSKNAKRMIKQLAKARKKADFWKKEMKVRVIYLTAMSLHKLENPQEFYVMTAIKAAQIESKPERYEFLYDEICFFLDHVCAAGNICDFKDNQCFVQRGGNRTMGCCHHFPNKRWGVFYQKEKMVCEHLGKTGCQTKCIGCKLFLCDEAQKKGVHFTVFNVPLIRYFFNLPQKLIIRTSVFETKEKIMKKLLQYG